MGEAGKLRKRYVQVGLGSRSGMYTDAIVDTFADCAELVALCDTNPGRMELVNRGLEAKRHPRVPCYAPEQFDRMVHETMADAVIVATVDQFHDHYICRALELGCDAITEKPMTTTAEKCQRILDAVAKSRRSVRVTFNYRYAPTRSQVKQLLMDGTIGKVLSVDFHWMLNTDHGADYYRRWHRNKVNSGGLLVHKATHHFDLVNWWLSTRPAEVFCLGDRKFYRPETAVKLGLHDRGERCLTCPVKARCPVCLDLNKFAGLKQMYLDNEQHDGYFRDRCVFGAEIDIEDTMNLTVKYKSGVLMSYSLNSFMPWEGYRVVFNGDRGRLEHTMIETVYVSGDGNVPGEVVQQGTTIQVYPHFREACSIPIAVGKGGHGGGDVRLLASLFDPNAPADPLKRAANQVQGAWSILTGIAANKSMETGQPVKVDGLVTGLDEPDFPPMPE